MTKPDVGLVHLSMEDASLVLRVSSAAPEIVYFGPWLADVDVDRLTPSIDWPAPEAGYDQLPPIALYPESTSGFAGAPGLSGRREDGTGSAPQMRLHRWNQQGPAVCEIALIDEAAGLLQDISIHAGRSTSVVTIESTLTNIGDTSYELDALMLTVPICRSTTEAMWLRGRWSREFQPMRHSLESGPISIENRRGRTSHDRLPFLAVGTRGFSEESGEVLAMHFGWSGNSIVRAEVLSDGRRIMQAGELLLPGEVALKPGENYVAPPVFLAASDAGLNGTSAAFHRHLRSRPQHPRTVRPVVLNTWEAVYFDHDMETLQALASRAARIGVERFVLDDGWFHGRRSDRSGLGDWSVDVTVWPDGLGPLIEHVNELGMEFGIWVEPEMVSPDSELYRRHPEWVLTAPGVNPALFRNQLPLNLVDGDAFAHVFEALDRLLSENNIAFVKWDMNRDVSSPEHAGRAAGRRQTKAVYELIGALRAAHPTIEIESCSSGGGRADFGILGVTDRIWASDCNDPLDRQHIQRGFSYLFPPELMGSHIGPPRAHTTGRVQDLAFRSATALFGHLGIEWNLLDASDAELDELGAIVAAHKDLRPLLHGGDFRRLDHPDPSILGHAVLAQDRRSAVVSVAQVDSAASWAVSPLLVRGFDSDALLKVRVLDAVRPAPGKAYVQPGWWTDGGGAEVTGRQLAIAGLQLPILHPSTALVLTIEAVD